MLVIRLRTSSPNHLLTRNISAMCLKTKSIIMPFFSLMSCFFPVDGLTLALALTVSAAHNIHGKTRERKITLTPWMWQLFSTHVSHPLTWSYWACTDRHRVRSFLSPFVSTTPFNLSRVVWWQGLKCLAWFSNQLIFAKETRRTHSLKWMEGEDEGENFRRLG